MNIYFILILTFAALKGLQDYVMVHHSNSWKNKYKQPFEPIPKGLYGWYHRINVLSYKEKFPFAATFLVSLSDWWHFFGLCKFLTVYLIIANAMQLFTWQPFVLYWVGVGITYKLLRFIKQNKA